MKKNFLILSILLLLPPIVMVPLSGLVAWSSLQFFCKLSDDRMCFPLGTMFAGIYQTCTCKVSILSRVFHVGIIIVCVVIVIAVGIRWLSHYFEKKRCPGIQNTDYIILTFINIVLTFVIILPMCIEVFFWPFFPGVVRGIEKQFTPFAAAMEEYYDTHDRYPLQQYRKTYEKKPQPRYPGYRRQKRSKYRPSAAHPIIELPFDPPENCTNKHWNDKSWAYHEYMDGGGYCLEIPLPGTPPFTQSPFSLNAYVLIICHGIAEFQRDGDCSVLKEGDNWKVLEVRCPNVEMM